jgi:quercetin dioxygenase-like cupin family protein
MTKATETQSAISPQARSDRVLDFQPGMAMCWEITQSAADTAGALLETVNWVGPRTGGPPVHVHPTAEESYEVIDGTLEVLIDGQWRTLHAGETATVPPGARHTLKNSSGTPVRLINTHRPALRFEQMFREMHLLISTRRIKRLPPPDPRSLLYAAMLFADYPEEQLFVKPPQAIFNALARLGRSFGLRLG